MLRLIPTKCHVSTIITNKTLISFSISGKISRWKGSRANIPTPYIYDVSLLKITLHFASFYYPSATGNLVLSIGYDLYSNLSIIQYNGYICKMKRGIGIKLDCNLDYELHATECYRMVAYKLYLLTRIQRYINIEQAICIYRSKILPYFDYGDIFYNNTFQRILYKL